MSVLSAPRVENDLVRVLLVEDNDGDARLVQLMLEGRFGLDMDLARARSLAEALKGVVAL